MAKGKYEKWLEPDGLQLLGAWARDGLTDEQIAKNMGICRDTLIQWKKTLSRHFRHLKKELLSHRKAPQKPTFKIPKGA